MRRLPLGVLAVSVSVLALHLACWGGYGFFRDELYFIACGRHLAWGYVDQPPLIALVARIAELLSSRSLVLFRLPANLAHVATVLLSAALACRFGASRFGALLAAVCTGAAPVLLANGQLLTMNAFEPLLWLGLAYVLCWTLDEGDARGWIVAGALVGVGVLNKHSMAFFAACAFVGVLSTARGRSVARSTEFAVGAALAAAIVLPHAIWQVRAGFPMLELLRNGQAYKNAPFNLLELWRGQVLEMNPVALPVVLGGAAWLLVRQRGSGPRALGVACLSAEVLFAAMKAKAYYLAPLYPILFAAGGAALDSWLARWPRSRWLAPGLLATVGVVALPVSLPILPVEQTERYLVATGVQPPRLERLEYRVLPQHLADQFGWPQLAQAVAAVHASLSPEERAQAVVFAPNYGEAAALDFFGAEAGLPPATSGHNSYFLWGPHGEGRVAIVLGGKAQDHQRYYEQVEQVGTTPPNPHGMPYEDARPIFVLRRPRVPLLKIWPALKLYI